MDTIDMGRRTGTRATRKATRQGGADLPLITYTPNYREVEGISKKIVKGHIDPVKWNYKNPEYLHHFPLPLAL